MANKKVRIVLWIAGGLLLVAGIVFLLSHKTNVVETLKREVAEVFVYEYIPNQKIDILTTQAFLQKDSIYEDFRHKFRFHYQTLGVANFADSSKLILIAEPTPFFEVDSIASICQKFTHSFEPKYHKIGYDGRITDLVIILANATEENVENLLKKLSKQLYLSDYKPFAIDLPVKDSKVYFSKSNLDYQISLYEFYDWFIENQEPFVALPDTNKTYSIQDIFKQKRRGVFFSQLPGFVAWAIEKKADLKAQESDVRQFVLDSDLILGGLSDSSTLVVIGREREAPLNELPPLDVESVLLLAATSEKELSQSLDVNDLMAGKMKNGSDWCPTYLSKELENTEFGHLMTITDILLKNWSESGTIQEAYYRYPKPGYYPFDKPLFKKLGLNELVYNWNTTDAMYAIDLEEATIYTLNHTGSLPVSYFNSPERSVSIGSKYENRAYHYFSSLNNTDLVRVVQYTALYQLFVDNDIHYSGNLHLSFPTNKPYLLLKPTQTLLNALKNFKEEEINYLCDSITSRVWQHFHKEKVLAQMADNEQRYHFKYSEEDRNNIINDIKTDNKQHLKSDIYEVKNMLNSLSEEQFKKLSKFLACPRGNRVHDRESYNIYMKGRRVNELMRNIGKDNLAILGLDLSDVKNYYVGSLKNSSAKYLKTPSVIITFNDFYTTGGHNLSSRISRVHSMKNYKRSHGGGSMEEFGSPVPTSEPIAEATSPRTDKAQPAKAKNPAAGRGNGVPKSGGKSSGSSTRSSSKTTAGSPTAKSGGGHNTRPRSAVISAAARGKRGF